MDSPIENFPTGIGQTQVCLLLRPSKDRQYIHAGLRLVTRRSSMSLAYGSTIGDQSREDVVRVMVSGQEATMIVGAVAFIFATHRRLRNALQWLKSHGITVEYHDEEAEAAFA